MDIFKKGDKVKWKLDSNVKGIVDTVMKEYGIVSVKIGVLKSVFAYEQLELDKEEKALPNR